nr:hypothetical protein CFP56_72017 [Quercus suber]
MCRVCTTSAVEARTFQTIRHAHETNTEVLVGPTYTTAIPYGDFALYVFAEWTSRISWSTFGEDADRDGDWIVTVPFGERRGPFPTSPLGVTVPDSLGPTAGLPGRELVDAKRFDNEAFDRRYGRLEIDERGVRLVEGCFATGIISESDNCGDCRLSPGVGVISEACEIGRRTKRKSLISHLQNARFGK